MPLIAALTCEVRPVSACGNAESIADVNDDTFSDSQPTMSVDACWVCDATSPSSFAKFWLACAPAFSLISAEPSPLAPPDFACELRPALAALNLAFSACAPACTCDFAA